MPNCYVRHLVLIFFIAAWTAPATAQHTFTPFDLIDVPLDGSVEGEFFDEADVPDAQYLFFTVTADFEPEDEFSWSLEYEMSIVGLSSAEYVPFIFPTHGARGDNEPTQLVWEGVMLSKYEGDEDLAVGFRDGGPCGCGGTNGNLENVTVTILPYDAPPVQVAPFDTGLIESEVTEFTEVVTAGMFPDEQYLFFTVTADFSSIDDGYSLAYQMSLQSGGDVLLPFRFATSGAQDDDSNTELKWTGVMLSPYDGQSDLEIKFRDLDEFGAGFTSQLENVSVTLYRSATPSTTFGSFNTGQIQNGQPAFEMSLNPGIVPDAALLFYSVRADFFSDVDDPAFSDTYQMSLHDGSGETFVPFGTANSGAIFGPMDTELVWTGVMLNAWDGVDNLVVSFRDVLPAICGCPDAIGHLENITVSVHPYSLDGSAVNSVPLAQQDLVTTPEDSPIVIDVLANDTEPDGDALSVSIAAPPSNGSIELHPDDTFTYTPAPNFSGEDRFDYTATDPFGFSDTEAVRITVTPVNDPPVAVDDNAETNETTPVDIAVLENDADVESEVTITQIGDPENGTAVDKGEGIITYTPVPGFSGEDSFMYTITDGELIIQATVTVTVISVNEAPVAMDDTGSVFPGETVLVDLLANDSDLNLDALSILSIETPGLGTIVDNGDGTISYTANGNADGTDNFEYTVVDPDGLTASATVQITVTGAGADGDGVPDDVENAGPNGGDSNEDGIPDSEQGNVSTIPIATGPNTGQFKTLSVPEGQILTRVRSIENPSPGDFPEGFEVPAGFLAFEISGIPTGGATVATLRIPIVTTGFLKYGSTPENPVPHWYDFAFDGTTGAIIRGTTIELHFVDGARGDADLTENGIIVDPGAPVLTTNAPPSAADDGATTAEDTSLFIDVLANDSDPDDDELIVLLETETENGALSENGGSFEYVPDPNFFGTDSFTYLLVDEHGATSVALVSITVTPVQDAPVARNDEAIAGRNQSVVIDIFGNDEDPDGDHFWLTSQDDAQHGVSVFNENGTVTYTPVAGFRGTDTWTYTISDGPDKSGQIVQATITVTVANSAPSFPSETPITSPAEGEQVLLGFPAGDPQNPSDVVQVVISEGSDADGDPVFYGWELGLDAEFHQSLLIAELGTEPVADVPVQSLVSILEDNGIVMVPGDELTVYQRAYIGDGIDVVSSQAQSFVFVRVLITDSYEHDEVPTEITLSQNYPNPFNPSTTIEFSLPKKTMTRLNVYDMQGRLVRTLVNTTLEAGVHRQTLRMDGLPSGVYVYRLSAGDKIQSRMLNLIK